MGAGPNIIIPFYLAEDQNRNTPFPIFLLTHPGFHTIMTSER